MVQFMELNFLIYPEKREFDLVIKETYELMLLLQEAGLGVEPNYETVWKKSDAKLFDWSYENFSRLMKKELKPGDEELGVNLSFFSSLEDDKSGGIIITTGCYHKRLKNFVDITFPYTLPNDGQTAIRIESLFRKCIELLHPYEGIVKNGRNYRRYLNTAKKGMPATVNWINYYASPELLDILSRADGKYTFYQKEKFQDGYYFKIQELPIDDDNEEDIKRQMEINRILGLQ